MSTLDPSAEPPAPLEARVQPTRGDHLHALSTSIPGAAFLFVVSSITYVWWVQVALRGGTAVEWARLASLPIAALLFELSYRTVKAGIAFSFDDGGVRLERSGKRLDRSWRGLKVRETPEAYVFSFFALIGTVLPKRALRPGDDGRLRHWLGTKGVPVRARAGSQLGTAVLVVVGILIFVTVYNLFQSTHPRHRQKARRQVEVVVAEPRSDDGAAALTMLLRYHGKDVALADVRPMVAQVDETANALELVRAAKRSGLVLTGRKFDAPELLDELPLPCIAHLYEERGEFPRPLSAMAGRFVVLEDVRRDGVTYVDPVEGGRLLRSRDEFLAFASGVVLIGE